MTRFLKRAWFDLLALSALFVLALIAPAEIMGEGARAGLAGIVFVKFVCVSMGVVHAHVTRKALFPYIDFRAEAGLTSNAVLVIALYATIIWAWARGG